MGHHAARDSYKSQVMPHIQWIRRPDKDWAGRGEGKPLLGYVNKDGRLLHVEAGHRSINGGGISSINLKVAPPSHFASKQTPMLVWMQGNKHPWPQLWRSGHQKFPWSAGTRPVLAKHELTEEDQGLTFTGLIEKYPPPENAP